MNKPNTMSSFIFDRLILRHPILVLLCVLAVVGFLAYQARGFRLDASAETLVLENDADLQYSRVINARYQQSDLLALSYTPKGELFSDATLTRLGQLRDELEALKNVASVTTILDVPLLNSPRLSLEELTEREELPTLSSPTTDRELAKKEFLNSPLYRDLLVSADMKTTAVLINFVDDTVYDDFRKKRDALREKEVSGSITLEEQAELGRVIEEFQQYRDQARTTRHHDIRAIRAIMDGYRDDAELFLGGVSMVADDMITFIKNDLRIFGSAVFLILVLVIAAIFRRLYWVVLPMMTCVVSVISTIGVLGWAGWEVTVISSNFISLQLIITLAMTIHLMVRYREFAADEPLASQQELIRNTIGAMLRPCLFSGLTTMAGFASLVFCSIRPVINFGYIMVVGVGISMLVPFLILPAVLALVPRDKPWSMVHSRWQPTPMLGRFTVAHGPLIVIGSIVLLIINIAGIYRLEVENCFINYFKSTTEIHQGMKVLDQQLGGTTPLDVVIDLEQIPSAAPVEAEVVSDTDSEFDPFEEFDNAAKENKEKYWFTPEKIAQIAAVHDYLDSLPETGKVLSVVSLVRMIEQTKGGKALDNVELALLFNKIPAQLKELLVAPYVSIEENEFRLAVRIRDSEPTLKRNELLSRIRTDLTEKLGFKPEQVHLTGMLVLYNNMLQSLYTSQIATMGFASLFLMGTFLILFRSVRIAMIAIFPNLLAISCVLGVMGWLNIPLDMMTITIAAIGVGLADDDTIHYIHRFKHEVMTDGSYQAALHRSHDSIGHAIYYTTITLVIGFSILCLSNFIPTIYFGLLTVLAITVALLASLTLLPQLLVLVKPYGRNPANNRQDSQEKKS
ncbi:MAG: MMPL family transporter [Anaerohalosphaeraceae bacterium]